MKQIWRLKSDGEYGYGPSTSRNTGVKQSKGDVVSYNTCSEKSSPLCSSSSQIMYAFSTSTL